MKISQPAKQIHQFLIQHQLTHLHLNKVLSIESSYSKIPYEQINFQNDTMTGFVNVYSEWVYQLRWETDDNTYPIYGLFQGKLFFLHVDDLIMFMTRAIVLKDKNCFFVSHY